MNQAWNLESFIDALVVELDKTRETLSVKAINKPLSYSVKDMAMDLQIFPTYDGREVRFVTAQPGESGSSKVSIQLAAITDRQVRETSKRPTTRDDIKIDDVVLEDDVKRNLRKIGVTSVGDLQRIESKDVQLESVVTKPISYSDIARQIRSARRGKNPPRVFSASLSGDPTSAARVVLEGENLALDRGFEPVVVLNGELATLISHRRDGLTFSCPPGSIADGDNELVLVLDPDAIVKVNVRRDVQEVIS